MNLSGPWWTNDGALESQQEYPPQEALFRVEFASTGSAQLQLAAQNYYQVWLNGVWLGYGPARASHGRLTVDTWSLPATQLREKNTLTIQVLWEGLFTYDHVRGTPGVWLSLSGETGEIPCAIKASDRTGRTAGHRFSHQRGWGEEIDGRLRVNGWSQGPWEAADWVSPMRRLQDATVVLEPRDIKPYAFAERYARAVTWSGACDLRQRTEHRTMGYAPRAPVFEDGPASASRHIQEERLLPSRAVDQNLAALLSERVGVTVLETDPDGYDRTIQLDFGQETSGLFELTLEAPSGTVVEIGWSEGLWQEDRMGCWARSAQPDGSVAPRELCDSYQALRYTCRGGGIETFQSLFVVALRHARIAFRCPPEKAGAIELHRVRIRTVGYPIDRQGDFQCSDEALNRIHEASVHTMVNSVSDVFMDCPSRERGGWLNDSYWAAIGFDTIMGDHAFERRFLRQIIDSQTAMPLQGMVAPLYPSDCQQWKGFPTGQRPITGHGLFWLLQVERFLRLHGDAALKTAWRPAVDGMIKVLNTYRSAEGLLEQVPWDSFFDWSRFASGPLQTADNALYALVLRKLGETFQNSQWIEAGQQTWQTVESHAWDASRELYADTLVRDPKGILGPGSDCSASTNVVTLWTQFPSPERAHRVWRQVHNFRPNSVDRPLFGYETDFCRGNLFSMIYRFDIAGRRQELDCLQRDLRESYLPMLQRGQTTLGEHLGYESSLCHGLNAYVSHVLIHHLAGIELPDHPGGIIRIRPHPKHLTWCQARVPWMGGYVQVWWDQQQLMISLPRDQQGELILANKPPQRFQGVLDSRFPLTCPI